MAFRDATLVASPSSATNLVISEASLDVAGGEAGWQTATCATCAKRLTLKVRESAMTTLILRRCPPTIRTTDLTSGEGKRNATPAIKDVSTGSIYFSFFDPIVLVSPTKYPQQTV
jgi:hypothetical protein